MKWAERLPEKQLMIMLALGVGFFASVAAYILHRLIEVIQHLLTSRFDSTSHNLLYLVLPVVGIWLTMLFVRYVVKDNISHGITRILYAISSKKSRLKGHQSCSRDRLSGRTSGNASTSTTSN